MGRPKGSRNTRFTARAPRIDVRCPWLGCSATTLTYRSRAMWSGHRGLRDIFCPTHRALVLRLTGSSRMNGYGRVFANPARVYAARGAEPIALRVAAFAQNEEKCLACSTPLVFSEHGSTWEMDHRIPIFRGGLTTLANLAPMCTPCHREKSNAEIREVRATRPNTSRRFWHTHAHKDRLIGELREKIALLRLQNEELRAAASAESTDVVWGGHA